jgi:DNA ligase-1
MRDYTEKFKELREFVNKMNSSNSTNHKAEVLKEYEHHDFVKKVILYVYHPYWNFGVTPENLKKRSDLVASDEDSYSYFFILLDDLANRHITGHTAIAAVNRFIQDYSEFSDLLYQIFNRNLETRATTTIINRVWPKFIPTFEVSLAHDAAKVKGVDILDGTWHVSRKLDGVRCICIVKGDDVKFISRNGKEFHTLGKIKQEILRLGIDDVVLDGEICLMNEDGTDDFQGIMKQIQRKDHTIENPKYWIFDILQPTEFSGEIESPNFSVRVGSRTTWLSDIDATQILEVLPQVKILDETSLDELKAQSKDHNWEGLIARRDTPYQSGRTKNMLKIKEFFDAEYEVTSLIMGPQRIIVNGKEVEERMLSAVTIEHKGSKVQVGSGFTIEERQYYYKNPGEILGKIISVQYFEESRDQHGNNSLRFPVFKVNHGKIRSI